MYFDGMDCLQRFKLKEAEQAKKNSVVANHMDGFLKGSSRHPDHLGLRFCKNCNRFVPIQNFATGTRRFQCKRHAYIAVGRHSKAKMMAKPQKRALNKVWIQAYLDAKRQFNQKRIDIKQAEIDKFVRANVDIEMDTKSFYENLAISIVPVDPTQILSVLNVALVTTRTRRLLMQQLRRFGIEQYSSLLQTQTSGENSSIH